MGYTIRSRGANLRDGPVRVIQLRSFEPGPRINLANTDYTDSRDIDADHKLRAGDLLYRTRGSRFEAVAFQPDGMASVAASPLVVVRVRGPVVDPRYLAWFLNFDPETRTYIRKVTTKHTIPSISTSDIAAIPVALPPIRVQRAIADAAQLAQQHSEALARLQELHEKYWNAALGQAARQHHKE